MEWSQLSTAAANILERCWFSMHNDRATKYSVEIGKLLYTEKDIVTLDTLNEIFEFQKTNPHFNVTFSTHDQVIHVAGAYVFYEWEKFDNTLTELGSKTVLEVGDIFYHTYSDDMAYLHRETVEKITSKQVFFRSGYNLTTKTLNDMLLSGTPYITIKDSDFSQSFLFRESNRIVQAFDRQLLEDEFNNLFDLKSISDDKLQKIIDMLNESESENINISKNKKPVI